MAVQALEIGPPQLVSQTTAYALPGRLVRVHSVAAVEFSVDNSNWVALTGANTLGIECGAGFLRCTGGTTTIMLKSF